MAKRSRILNSSPEGVKEIKPAVAKDGAETTINVNVIAVYPSILKYTGQVTGQQYIWNGAGDIQAVDERDVPYLLKKRIGHRGCCGAVNQDGNKVFDLA